jgi:hypothetical protein
MSKNFFLKKVENFPQKIWLVLKFAVPLYPLSEKNYLGKASKRYLKRFPLDT